jgi:hypothetical protein
LLYIGKVEKQTFGHRVSQHNWQEWTSSETVIYFGRIHSDVKISNEEWESQIDLAENILIFSHSPAFNASRLNKISHKGGDVRVLNWGKRKSLFPEVSISRWESGETLGHRIPDKLKLLIDG